jgi:ABC-2 type transport system ATP-binding protein
MIKVENLTKSFGPKLAVDEISFAVERGEVLGFLGPNGAGKSTSMRMITGYLPPSGGRVVVGGFDVVDQPLEARRLIGYLPENAPIYADMSVHGFLGFCAEMRGLYGGKKKAAIDRVIELCFLQRVVNQSVDTLSKGYRHRTCLAQALIHDPDILIMDEPTDGLDPNQKHEVRSLIRRMGESKAIIFSTHILEEVEAACSRVIIIDQGKLVANGTPQELKSRAPTAGDLLVSVHGEPVETVANELRALTSVADVKVLNTETNPALLRITPKGNALSDVTALGARRGWQFDRFQMEEGRLDDVFRSITLSDTSRPA